MKSDPIAKTSAALARVRRQIESGVVPRATSEWGGANVVVSSNPLGTRYREIVTPHSLEVSWAFERLRDAFVGLIDPCSKFEFYGRLELAANRTIAADSHVDAAKLSKALLDEADAMLAEMSAGHFECLAIANGTEIAADNGSVTDLR